MLFVLSFVADVLFGLPGPDLPFVEAFPVSSVAFLVLICEGDILAVLDDELLEEELVPVSSNPRLGLLDTAFTVVAFDADEVAIDILISVDSDFVILPLPFEVGRAEVLTVECLSAAAAKAAVCWRAERLSFAPASCDAITLLVCSVDDSSITAFLVLLGLGDALEAGLEPFEVIPPVVFVFVLFPLCEFLVKLQS